MAQSDHDRVIAAAAKAALAPLGLTRKGRSRTWLDDHGWWLGIVEFQPSSWARGTYLNVGLMFLWRPIDHLAFEIGYRVEGFSDAVGSEFAGEAEAKARRAGREVVDLRARFSSLDDVVQHFRGARRPSMYDQAHLATSLGLGGDLPGCQQAFDRALAMRHDAPANQREATRYMVSAREAANDARSFHGWVQDVTTRTRNTLGLAETNVTLPQR